MGDHVRLLLAGDVMLGRGIDQIQAHPGDPTIHESWAKTSVRYLELAEARSGAIPRKVASTYVWGDLLPTIRKAETDAFIVNLETAVTERGRPWPGKGIQYRMHPDNIGSLSAAGVDVVSLANNHVLDWSEPGLLQTLDTLDAAGIARAGAGRDDRTAWSPARLDGPHGGVVVLGVGTPGSGIPSEWAAQGSRAGVALVSSFSKRTLDRVGTALARVKQRGDLAVASIHWGGNWGYGVATARRRFAQRLIEDTGVDVVHGHSSHHPVGIEVHRGGLILYGCGDLITDYEGITGHEEFRGELGGLYLAELDSSGLARLRIVPSRMQRFQLTTPSTADRRWLASQLDDVCRAFGTAVTLDPDGNLEVSW